MPAAAPAPHGDRLLDELRRAFGHEAFRPGQRDVVECVVSGRDCIVVMPTGGGKSLCYQLPATLDQAPTIVVSPLIALMKDQVDALRACGVEASALHHNLDSATQRTVTAAYRSGLLRLLYVAPERLVRADLRAMLVERPPARIVVDEAHCISEWGHDFRRDYLRIGEVAGQLAPVQIVACTATATPAVRDDIALRLGLVDPVTFVRGFARPELHLAVRRVRDEGEKVALLDELIDPGEGHAIVYAGTRARAASVAEHLAGRLPTMLYHADLASSERSEAQERFASGRVRVAVATSAFGMGVDVPTVRQVVHMALPSSLEEYYQQAGRAGRDGERASCVVIHAPADRRLPEFFIDAAHPDAATLAAVYTALAAEGRDPGSWRAVGGRDGAAAGLSDAAGDASRAILADAGLVEPDGTIVACDPSRLPVDHGRIAAHRRAAYDRFGRLLAYLGTAACRHQTIQEHFGEPIAGAECGDRCDVCSGATSPVHALDDTPIRQALSAVARLNGRVGLARVASVLVGSRSKQVLDVPGLATIPTYGALRSWREADAAELLRRLVDAGAVRQTPPPYPLLVITPTGIAAMRGTERLVVEDPRRAAAARSAGGRSGGGAGAGLPDLDEEGGRVFDRLRAWRSAEARRRDLPPYVVFHDRHLAEIAARRPGSSEDLLGVPGVGPGKLQLYGGEILRIVAGAAGGDPAP
ncbi:MAG TPA: RecQ family ATP-dependent DNA helicase [Candidatus Dormibacteraeota bacterium]|nr:RecQ family ATP-dependent DNA helicase [Candidatus Dormibacteraeota bacterium]